MEEIEITIISHLHEEDGDEIKIIKENIEQKLTIYISDIVGIKEIFDEEGNIEKENCEIYHEHYGQLYVKGSYKSLRDIVFIKRKNVSGYGK